MVFRPLKSCLKYWLSFEFWFSGRILGGKLMSETFCMMVNYPFWFKFVASAHLQTDAATITHQGPLQRLRIRPFGLKVRVIVILSKPFVFFLLLVIMRHHRLVRLFVDTGLSNWGAGFFVLQTSHNLRLLIRSKMITCWSIQTNFVEIATTFE